MIVYKVVKEDKKGMHSAKVLRGSYFFRRYNIGKTTKKRVGPLFAFEDYDSAHTFRCGNEEIVQCDAVKCKTDIPARRSTINCCSFKQQQYLFKSFWLGKSTSFDTWLVPDGTVLCDELTPLSVVK